MSADIYHTFERAKDYQWTILYSHLKYQFYNPHPSMYNFIYVLKKHQAEVYLRLQSNRQNTNNFICFYGMFIFALLAYVWLSGSYFTLMGYSLQPANRTYKGNWKVTSERSQKIPC